MSVWAILKNIRTIIGLLKSLKEMISDVATNKKAPSPQSIKVVIDHVQKLLDSGAIDIPGVDEKEVSEALEQIEKALLTP